ncbi:OLC1v1015728C2 [Oldenlandia corymbosa var. corymbosa]|uniref:OLC1v1015728C2 n=1 Tax=Oldenlandia corymbosa var. corymbosa TaxID=529605 RepID=A0AAV1E4S9_OLDCO|nr:OLC1v1015728C2 [Oldenlandia corymbosa var. corymbosa]
MTTIPTSFSSSIDLFSHLTNKDDIKLSITRGGKQQRKRAFTVFAAKSGGFSLNSILKKCERCGGQGAIECPGCKGTGKNKKNGNIFERWKSWK